MRVLVADDHPIYREGLTRGIKEWPELELVGEAADGREALEAIRSLAPDVAVLDVRMPGLGGLDVLNALVRDRLTTRVVFLSANVDGATVYRAVAAGAGAFLSKEASRREIFEAVSTVARGETFLSSTELTALAGQVRLRAAADRPVLSAREREILGMTADGVSAPDIAARLHLSPATVKTHLRSLYEKLGVSDRAAAVAAAMRAGLLE